MFYKGALLTGRGDGPVGADVWELTTDSTKLLEADPGEVLWVETAEDLEIALDDLYPCDVPGLSRVGRCGASDRFMAFKHPVLVLRSATSEDQGVTGLLDAVQKAGTLCVMGSFFRNGVLLRDHPLLSDCVFSRTGMYSDAFLVKLDPKAAARQRAGAVRKKLTKHVTVDELGSVLWRMEVATDPPYPAVGKCGLGSRSDYVSWLSVRLVVFNVMYGRGAHRRFEPWQKLVERWRDSRAASEKAFSCSCRFVEFMAAECRARFKEPWPDSHYCGGNRPKEIRLP